MLGSLCLSVRPLACSLVPVRHLNANRCAVTKIKRAKFSRVYPTTAVLPDGSTISGRAALVGLDSTDMP